MRWYFYLSVVGAFFFQLARTSAQDIQSDIWRYAQKESVVDTQAILNILKYSYDNRLKNSDTALHYARIALRFSEALEYESGSSRANRFLGFTYEHSEHPDSSKVFFWRAIANCTTPAANNELARAYIALVNHYKAFEAPPIDSCFFYLTRMDRLTEKMGRFRQLLYREYGEIYEQIEDYPKAEEYYLKLLEYTKENNLIADQNIAYYYLVGVARELGNPVAYSNYLNEYLKMRGELTRETLEGKYHSGLLLLGNDSLEQAIPTLQANLKTHLSLEHYHPAITTLFILAKAYDKTGNHEAALDALEQQIGLSEGFANVSAMVLSYQDAYKQAEILEDWDKASYYLNQFTTLRNELYRSEQRDRMEELAVAFEAEKQEQAIRIQALELQKKTNQRNFFIVSSLLLLVLAIIIFVGARQIMRTRKQLALQKAQIQEQDILHLTRQKKLTKIKAMAKGQEIERLRVAKDLQDTLGVLLHQVDQSFDQILPEKKAHSDLANKTRGFLTEAQNEMHRIAQDLHPEILIRHGLGGALQALGEQITARGLSVNLQLEQLKESEDPAKSASVYRIVQEIVHNAIKHAEAEILSIQAHNEGDLLQLVVSDDGKGMAGTSKPSPSGIGLQNIKSRMDFLNGTWDLQTTPGEGTIYTLVIPQWNHSNSEMLEPHE